MLGKFAAAFYNWIDARLGRGRNVYFRPRCENGAITSGAIDIYGYKCRATERSSWREKKTLEFGHSVFSMKRCDRRNFIAVSNLVKESGIGLSKILKIAIGLD